MFFPTRKLIIFLLLAQVMLISNFANASTVQFVLPDKMQIKVVNGTPLISIEKEHKKTFRARITFEPSYDLAKNFLISSHQDSMNPLDIIEVPIEVDEFVTLNPLTYSEFVVTSSSKNFLGNQVRMEMTFRSELSIEKITELFTFNMVYGFVKAKVVCGNHSSYPFCGKYLQSFPAYNQFKIPNSNEDNSILYGKFGMLNDFKNRVFLGSTEKISSLNKLDIYAKLKLFNRKACKDGISDFENEICSIIIEHAHDKKLTTALNNLAKKIFPQNILNQDMSTYIFSVEPLRVAPGEISMPNIINSSSDPFQFAYIGSNAKPRLQYPYHPIQFDVALEKNGFIADFVLEEDSCDLFRIHEGLLIINQDLTEVFKRNWYCKVSVRKKVGNLLSEPWKFALILTDGDPDDDEYEIPPEKQIEIQKLFKSLDVPQE